MFELISQFVRVSFHRVHSNSNFSLNVTRACQRTHWPNHKSLCRPNTENVGLPFLVSVPESRLSYARLTQLLEGYSRYVCSNQVLSFVSFQDSEHNVALLLQNTPRGTDLV